MEYARGEGGVSPAGGQDFLDVSDASGATGGYHRMVSSSARWEYACTA